MTSLRRLLDEGRLRVQSTSASEVVNLFKVGERDLADARIDAVSVDRRFATAYNAALQCATIALRAEGYRTVGAGHHWTTFAALPAILGSKLQTTADYLDVLWYTVGALAAAVGWGWWYRERDSLPVG